MPASIRWDLSNFRGLPVSISVTGEHFCFRKQKHGFLSRCLSRQSISLSKRSEFRMVPLTKYCTSSWVWGHLLRAPGSETCIHMQQGMHSKAHPLLHSRSTSGSAYTHCSQAQQVAARGREPKISPLLALQKRWWTRAKHPVTQISLVCWQSDHTGFAYGI